MLPLSSLQLSLKQILREGFGYNWERKGNNLVATEVGKSIKDVLMSNNYGGQLAIKHCGDSRDYEEDILKLSSEG